MATFMEILTWIRHCPGAEKIASRIVSGLFVFAFSIALVSTSAFGQIEGGEGNFTIRQPIASQMGDLPAHVLAEGAELEKSRRWGEALNVYQQALKKYPQNAELKQRRAVARIHYDLSRRYSDSSFVQTIGSTDGNTALNVYAEILLKVQSYYVDEPNWADLASYGLTSLEVALMSPEFRRINLTGVSDEQIRQTILTTRKRSVQSARVNNRHDAYIVGSGSNGSIHCGSRESAWLVQATACTSSLAGPFPHWTPIPRSCPATSTGETMSQIEGNFVGLGVELRTHPDHLEIVSVISRRIGWLKARIGQEGDRSRRLSITRSVPQIGADRARRHDAWPRRVPKLYRSPSTVGKGPQTVKLQRRRVEIPSVDHVGIVDAPTLVWAISSLTNFQKDNGARF
jgi:carboxyl-terminal processing protease